MPEAPADNASDAIDVEAADSVEAREPLQSGTFIEPVEHVELLEPVEPRIADSARLEHAGEAASADSHVPARAEAAATVEAPGEPAHVEPLPERYARIGAEALRRLRSRYADLKGRLEAAALDEAARAEPSARLERLNPDAWLTDEEVAAALEEYESVFESLRPIVGRQPRPRRL